MKKIYIAIFLLFMATQPFLQANATCEDMFIRPQNYPHAVFEYHSFTSEVDGYDKKIEPLVKKVVSYAEKKFPGVFTLNLNDDYFCTKDGPNKSKQYLEYLKQREITKDILRDIFIISLSRYDNDLYLSGVKNGIITWDKNVDKNTVNYLIEYQEKVFITRLKELIRLKNILNK